MPAIGFVDDKGQRVTFADALAGKGSFTLRRPMLAAMARQKAKYADTTVTELLPVGVQRQRILKARHDYYIVPDKQRRLMFGSALHSLLAENASDLAAVEQPMVALIDGVKVGGTADTRQLWPSTKELPWPTLEIIDWKGTNVAAVKHMGESGKTDEGAAQLNSYWLLENISPDSLILKAGLKPETVKPVLVLENISQDYRDYEADRASPAKPYPRWHEPFEVPAAPVSATLSGLRAAIRKWKAAQKLADDDLPKCEAGLLWGGKRCRDYCEAAPFCRYAAANIEKLAGKTNY